MKEDMFTSALGMRPLKDVLDIESTEITEYVKHEITTTEAIPIPEPNIEMLDDIEFARKNVKNLLIKGAEALDSLVDLAKTSESPRAFEVVADMVRSLTEVNEKYIGIAEKKKYEKTEQPANHETKGTVINNNILLSTNDMLRSIRAIDNNE